MEAASGHGPLGGSISSLSLPESQTLGLAPVYLESLREEPEGPSSLLKDDITRGLLEVSEGGKQLMSLSLNFYTVGLPI